MVSQPENELAPVSPTRAERALGQIAVVGLFLMAALITLNVISRWIGRAIIPDDIQLVKELMVVVILLPLGVVTATRNHISVDLFTEWMAKRGRHRLGVLEQLVGIVFVSLVSYAAYRDSLGAWESQDYYSGVLNIPMWLGHFVFLFGMAVFLIRLLVMFLIDLRRSF